MFGHLDIVQSVGLPETLKSLMDTSADLLTARSVPYIPIHVEPVNVIHVETSTVSKKKTAIMVSATVVKKL
jgi:hypothetical protein